MNSFLLIVDDDEGTAALYRSTLRRAGYRTLTVSAIGSALDALREEKFDLVILDYALPDGSAWNVLDVARSLRNPVPVILATGMGDEQIAGEALRRGATDYLVKAPGIWKQLPAVVERALVLSRTQELDARLGAIFDASHEPIIALDLATCITHWNPAAVNSYGIGLRQAIGVPFKNLMPEQERLAFEAAIHKVMDGHRTLGRAKRLHRDGHAFVTSASMAPMKNASGQTIGIVLVEQDQTPLLKIEQLQRINEELDQFSSAVAHDLQAPLATARLCLDILRMDHATKLPEEATEHLDTALSALASAHTMVGRLLGYAKEAAVDLRDEVDLDPADAVSQAIMNLGDRTRDAEIVVQPLPQVRFDAAHLVQIFQNLIGNAITHAASDHAVRIEISEIESDARFVTIAVTDNGPGIPLQEQQRIFQLYQRSPQSADHGGHGIGLALCKKLVEARGGRISVRSRPAEGATFLLELPAAVDSLPPDTRPLLRSLR